MVANVLSRLEKFVRMTAADSQVTRKVLLLLLGNEGRERCDILT
jgi:hypothetical protein